MEKTNILRSGECETVEMEWGSLTWYANEELGNSDTITVGKCVIAPGRSNPPHSHPNCSEVLVVLRGRIAHTVEGGKEVELGEGDVISIPENVPHRARNIAEEDAVLLIAFSSAGRQTCGE